MIWEIVFASGAQEMLQGIKDRRIREKICERIDGLKEEPEKQGKPLIGELSGYRSIRAVGQRYRIIYRVEGSMVLVIVVAIGIRKESARRDIYSLAKKLIQLKLI